MELPTVRCFVCSEEFSFSEYKVAGALFARRNNYSLLKLYPFRAEPCEYRFPSLSSRASGILR